MFAKYFTPKEANRLLPVLKPIVTEILAKGKKLRTMMKADPEFAASTEAMRMQEVISDLTSDLEQNGCFFKDWNFEVGLVDFPAIVDDEEVLLCWRSDEGEVLWYHGVEDGYAGRRPVPEYWLLDMKEFGRS